MRKKWPSPTSNVPRRCRECGCPHLITVEVGTVREGTTTRRCSCRYCGAPCTIIQIDQAVSQ